MGRLRFVAGGVIIAVGVGVLVLTGVRQSASAHTTLAGLLHAPPAGRAALRRVQLGGSRVVPGSIVWGEFRSRPAFSITDGTRTLRAEYIGHATLPDTFQDGAPLVLEGRYDSTAEVFYAEVIYAKCPSRYEGLSYDRHLAARGQQ